MHRFRRLLISAAVGGLLVLAAIPLASYGNRRLAHILDNFFTDTLRLKAERLEVDLLGRRAWVRDLRATHPHALILSVEEISLEGVNLYALVFGVEDASLADKLLVRGVVPPDPYKGSLDGLALERAEIFELSGPFPGLLSLLHDPDGRAFDSAFPQMRAKVLRVDKLHLGISGLHAEAEALLGTDFSFSGQTSLMVRNVVWLEGNDRFFVENGVMGRRVTPGPEAFISDRVEDSEAERVRALATGLHLDGVILHKAGFRLQTHGMQAALLTVGAFSDTGSTRLALNLKGLEDITQGEPWSPFAVADGDLAADLLLEAAGTGDSTFRQRLRLRLENPNQARLWDFLHLNWEQENPRSGNFRGIFPALEQSGPALVRADLEVSRRRGIPGKPGGPAPAGPDAVCTAGVRDAADFLKDEFPNLFAGKRAAQLDAFLASGGLLRLQAEPADPLPLVLLPDAMRQTLPSLGWKQTLNGVEAR